MIRSFADKDLEKCYYEGKCASISSTLKERILAKLDEMDAASSIQDLNTQSNRLHRLKGTWEGYWSIRINKNWRLVFTATGQGDGEFGDILYIDYH